MGESVERIYEVSIDPVTGLYDRRTMWARLAEEVSRARRYRYPLSLMLMTFDVDDAQCAERCLLQLVEVLKRHTRTSDILVRYSENSLILLLPCTNERGALALAERIRLLVLDMPDAAEGRGEPVAISIGVTSTPGEFIGDKVALVEQVEWALHRAQEQEGGDHIVVVPAPRRVRPENGENDL